jgi:eukaryotic-like serine/threonine-protein kinase
MANVENLLPRVGERIGSYQLVQELGRGGFSVVFRAVETSWNADVAIKFLAPPKTNPAQAQQILQRFQQEARVAQQLQHPSAIKVRDYGQTPTGLMYLVSDFIDGRTLTRVLAERPLSVDRTVHIASQVLGCLSDAHGRGIIHRDLKPDNIMLRNFSGDEDVVTILDFGVAKVSESYDGVVTQVGMTLGTPYYTAPEQCRGERVLDGRADLYSVGLILAECLTGRRVVGVDNQMAAVYIQAGAQPLEFEPALSASPLFPVIRRATQKPKEWRFPDAASMREALLLAAGHAGPSSSSVASRPHSDSASHQAAGQAGSWFDGGASASPPLAASPYPQPSSSSQPLLAPRRVSSSLPIARPRRRAAIWPWVFLIVVVAALIAVTLALRTPRQDREPGSDPLAQGASTHGVPAAPRDPVAEPVERVLDPPEAAPAPDAGNAPAPPQPVRATVRAIDDHDFERRVTLAGCGFASGLRVGERAPVGDIGLDLEITRLRDDSHCLTRTSATAAQLASVTEVVFRATAAGD